MHAHNHGSQNQSVTRLAVSLFITLGFVALEAAAGIWGHSLALLSDAGHNLTDVAALALSWYALRLAARTANARKTYGYHRAGILAALLNSATLVVIAIGILYEAYQRFHSPEPVNTSMLIGVGFIAVLINLGTALLVKRGSESDLNLRSAYVHLMGDVASTIGAVLAGIGILLTHWNWLDPLVSVLIAFLILWNAWGIIRETLEVLLEATPKDVDVDGMVAKVLSIPGVKGFHDLHVWSLNQSLRALSAHVVVGEATISEGVVIQKRVAEILEHEFAIGHTTLQLETDNCDPESLHCELDASDHEHSHGSHPK